jgi:hypothetical protein
LERLTASMATVQDKKNTDYLSPHLRVLQEPHAGSQQDAYKLTAPILVISYADMLQKRRRSGRDLRQKFYQPQER